MKDNNYKNRISTPVVSRSTILSVISDDKSLALLRTIASGNGDSNSDILRSTTMLTRTQYYSRIADFIKAGLVKRKNGKYFITSLGKVVYNNQRILESALANSWKLKAIDSFEILNGFSKEERQRFIDKLIDDHNIKTIITKEYSNPQMNNVLMQKSVETGYQRQEKSSFNIMIVEDEPDTLFTYKKFLATEGYNVDAYVDPYEALKHFVNLNRPYYDLVITDIRMPGLNGLQLYQRMKSIDDSINIIFVSAIDALEELASIFPSLSLGNIIRKPVTQEEFRDKVKAAIAQDGFIP
ncbi:MAG: response regulator [Nitrososphaeraceae archaeon]|nr:response regulator [Nitrososphaeraceae archaeon]